MAEPGRRLTAADLHDTPERRPVRGREERFSGAVISVRTDRVEMADGDVVDRDVVVHPGAVGVVALDDDGAMLLVRQYRHCAGRRLWEPPAGLLDEPGEPALLAAQRELAEEAGTRADEWHVLVDAFTSPGMSDEALRIYLARGLRPVPDHDRYEGEHEEADLEVAFATLDDVVEAALAGRLHNPITVMGALAAARRRDAGWTGLRAADAPWPERPEGAGSKG